MTKRDRLLSVEEVAERLNVTKRFVERLTSERRIPFHKVGRWTRIAESDLEAFLKAGRVEPELDAATRMKVGHASGR